MKLAIVVVVVLGVVGLVFWATAAAEEKRRNRDHYVANR